MMTLATTSEGAKLVLKLAIRDSFMEKIAVNHIVPLWCTSTITKVQNYFYNDKKQQIHNKHKIIREFLITGAVKVNHIWINENLTNPLTKGLARKKVFKTSERIRLMHIKQWVTYVKNPTCKLEIPKKNSKGNNWSCVIWNESRYNNPESHYHSLEYLHDILNHMKKLNLILNEVYTWCQVEYLPTKVV